MLDDPDPYFGDGQRVPIEGARAVIALCECPQLPSTGAMGPDRVIEAWATLEGRVWLIYDHGVELSYAPDGRTPSQYEADVAEMIADFDAQGIPDLFRLIDLRGKRGSGADIDPRGPASVGWIEGPYRLAVYANAGQTLAELITLAESLPPGPIQD